MKKINIAIDGLAGAGKSTVAKKIADKLNYIYVDSGSMYRSLAYLVYKEKLDSKKEEDLLYLLDNKFDFYFKEKEVFLNKENVSEKIRTPLVDTLVSDVVAFPEVRKRMVAIQREIAKNKGVVMDGRDIGIVVLKDSKVKVFLIASVEARAERRFMEYSNKGIKYSYEEIVENIKNRDYVDINISKALRKADDAVEIDTSNLTIDQVIEKIMKLVEERR